MPELPEVEITARRLDAALKGARIDSALAPGVNVMRTFQPPLDALRGREIAAVGRRGKNFLIDIGERRAADALVLVIHLMSAGRLQLYQTHAGPRDRTSRLLVRLAGGGELRLREFGTKQAAWAKLLEAHALEEEEALSKLGPEAWPDPPPLEELVGRVARPLHALLRDQRTIAGIGRSWVDEILWHARLSPFRRGSDLDESELSLLRETIASTLDRAIEHYERVVELPIPDKMPMPLSVHGRAGTPCPRCARVLEAVHFEDYVIAYCPVCQTDGHVLKDRRLSKLLK